MITTLCDRVCVAWSLMRYQFRDQMLKTDRQRGGRCEDVLYSQSACAFFVISSMVWGHTAGIMSHSGQAVGAVRVDLAAMLLALPFPNTLRGSCGQGGRSSQRHGPCERSVEITSAARVTDLLGASSSMASSSASGILLRCRASSSS